MSVEFISFFIILLAGLFLSSIFNRLHLPWVAGLIVAGMVAGPFGFTLFTPTDTLMFISEIGLVFLMFMAGLETRFVGFEGQYLRDVSIVAVLAATVPFLAGFGIATYFGYEMLSALLLGIVFISSSVAVIIPSMQSNNLFGTRVGKTIMGAAIVIDVLSLVLLSFLLQTVDPSSVLPLPLLYIILFVSLLLLRFFIPKVRQLFHFISTKKDTFEREVRLVFTIMIGVVILFEFLGLHSIVAGFFAGFVLSDTMRNELLKQKLHALAYGIFIPTFFVVLGANTNIGVFSEAGNALGIVITITATLVGAKVLSGYIAGRLVRFHRRGSILIGVALIPQLSTTLAALFTGVSLGLVDDTLLTTMIILSIITTLVAPLTISYLVHARSRPVT